MNDFELLVVGGGLTAAKAVRSYREAGGGGRVAIVSRDTSPPYHRPPLSKRFLRGEIEADGALVEPESWYGENEIELLLRTAVTRVRPGERRVELEDGSELGYSKLLVASGVRPRRLQAPGAELDGVHTLRTLDDSAAIREAARGVEQAVVVGGSFIGCEVAASLTQLGVHVTLVHVGRGLFDALRAPELSEFLHGLYRERGVDLALGDGITAFRGNGSVRSAETAAGKSLPAQLVVTGVGVEPVLEHLGELETANGVPVDRSFATSAPGVWAAGDIAEFPDPIYGRRRRIEHWSTAAYQGTQVGRVLAGEDAPYDTLSAFFSEVFGFMFRVFGDATGFDELVWEGSLEDGKAIGRYRSGGRTIAAVLTGQDDDTEAKLKDEIAEGARAVRS